jgi:hypothetical protein
VYVGKADVLRDRAWGNHMGEGATMGSSSFRRNVAEFLGFGTPAAIKAKRVRLTSDQLAFVRVWIVGCAVAWVECDTIAAAKGLEAQMKAEWLPPLTKR